MNKHLQNDEIAAARIDTKAAMRRMGMAPEYPGAPFSKRPEGKARRTERKQARARKMAWLNS